MKKRIFALLTATILLIVMACPAFAAAEDVRRGKGVTVPEHLQSPLFKGYKYPHDYENHYVAQQYLPDDLLGTVYYHPAPNKTEQAADEYWKKIKGKL